MTTPRPRRSSLASCLLLGAGSLIGACDSGLPRAHGSGGASASSLALSFVPAASVDHAPAIGWELLTSSGDLPTPDQVRVYQGALTTAELRAVLANKPSPALDARAVPAVGFAFGSALAVAPERVLDGGDYTLVVAAFGYSRTFHVVAADDPPILARAWPPKDVSAAASALVYCAPDSPALIGGAVPSLADAQSSATLPPAGVIGAFVSPFAPASRCLRFVGDDSITDGVVVPPPTLELAGAPFRLGPGHLSLSGGEAPDIVKCHAGERQIGPGCATVLDDRVRVRSPLAPIAWSIDGPNGATFRATRGGSRFAIRGLAPLESFTLDVTTLDTRGFQTSETFSATTVAALPHLVINEVYAHPLGPRPDQQWVEIYNDGATYQSLYGFALAQADVATPLPAVQLAPGAYSLVVTFGYQPDDGVDLAPPTTCPLARVTKIGKKGLAVGGELLQLLGPTGAVQSSFPAIAQHAAGVSASRSTPDATDDDPSAFSLGAGPPTPCEPNQGSSP